MYKKSLLSLALFTCSAQSFAANHIDFPFVNNDQENIETLKQNWQAEQQKTQKALAKQRQNYRQLETLLPQLTASASNNALIQHLLRLLDGYPLQENAEWLVFEEKLKQNTATESEIAAFFAKYPQHAQKKAIQQKPFETLFDEKKFAELRDYAKQVAPTGLENQCRWFAANYQLLKDLPAPKEGTALAPELQILLNQFDLFWQTREFPLGNGQKAVAESLPETCAEIEDFWQQQGMKTADKVRKQAVNFAQKNAKPALQKLIEQNKDEALTPWLNAVADLLNDPRNWQNFAKNQPLALENKMLVIEQFPAFVRTLTENNNEADFAPYLAFAEKWGLTDAQIQTWKTTFISRLFDNENSAFKQWRDEQLKQLNKDSLIERRIRVALRYQENPKEWLEQLSAEAKQKAEWRYWLAQNESNTEQKQKMLSALAKERGFYPMLAAHSLGIAYQFNAPASPAFTVSQLSDYQQPLAKIRELKLLGKNSVAQAEWIRWLKTLPTTAQLAAANYAQNEEWFDLSVEATIQAKAWDYLPLRLPNAYSDWFDLALQARKISKTFAMAIARQESAWNDEARSHANALGLMQMLPSTAEQTAKNQNLPYTDENSLLNPLNNILLGTAHLDELNEKYPDNRILIAAAYNAGAHRVTQWLERANGKLSMDAFIASIPFLETRGYVQNVLAYDYYQQQLQGAKNPQMFTKAESERKY